MEEIKYKDKIINFRLVKKKKKNLSIIVKNSGEIIAYSPLKLKYQEIERIILSKGDWILNKKELIENNNSRKKKRKYIDGDLFLYLGEKYRLKIINRDKIKGTKIRLEKEFLKIEKDSSKEFSKEKIIESLYKWYRERAKKIIEERVIFFGKKYNFNYGEIKIKKVKRYWGSCSAKGELNFNLKLIMAPIEIIDYVILHELCHTIHHNHRKEYWNLVEKYVVDYKVKRRWLRDNGVSFEI